MNHLAEILHSHHDAHLVHSIQIHPAEAGHLPDGLFAVGTAITRTELANQEIWVTQDDLL